MVGGVASSYNNDARFIPVCINPKGVKFKTISAGFDHLAALDIDNNLYFHGKNAFNQFGNTQSIRSDILVRSFDTPVNKSIISIFTGVHWTYLSMTCNAGHYGDECERYTCAGIDYSNTSVCSGNGACISYDNCICKNENYTSSHGTCTTTCFGLNEFDNRVCSSRGVCVNLDQCKCRESTFGSECDQTMCYGILSKDPNVCNAHGQCIDYECFCDRKYIGSDCSVHFIHLLYPPLITLLVLALVIATPPILKLTKRIYKQHKLNKKMVTLLEEELLVKNDELESINRSYLIDFDKLSFDQVMAKGAFGVVFRGSYLNSPVAIKVLESKMHQEEGDFDAFESEVKIMKSLRHLNIVQFMGVCVNQNKKIIVTELMEGSSLENILLKNRSTYVSLSLQRKLSLLTDIALGMTYLHSIDPPLVHRDLKLGNVLVDKSIKRAKVCDFGISKFFQNDYNMTGSVGTAGYIAPEIIRNEPYDTSCDVYSFGIIMYEFLSEKMAYSDEFVSIFLIAEKVKSGERPILDEELVVGRPHAEYVALMNDCWQNNKYERPTFDQVTKRLTIIKDLLTV
ncbi:serine/threonine-protein kinase/receptor [Acrasis kona]|uniref:Serine/threonine-protein kinase/receptor n=1 Tax=Acrasis kona TaxID=1008807 RepID=A0AAW2ZF81_9EUKA